MNSVQRPSAPPPAPVAAQPPIDPSSALRTAASVTKTTTIAGTAITTATHPSSSEIIATLGPTLDFAIRFQRLVSSVSLFLVLRTYFLAAVTATTTLVASRVLAVRGLLLVKALALSSARGIEALWKTKTVRRMRKKMEFEMAMIILDPGTNAVLIAVFWPGWWLIVGLAVAAKMMAV